MTDTGEDKAPHHVDQHVGRQIRELRRRLHVSQEKLAETLGLTFQQVQKYEKGANRVSASKLFEVAGALGVDVDYFFRGLARPAAPGVSEDETEPFVHAAPMTVEAIEIDRLFLDMKRKHRRLVLDMARALVAEGRGAAEVEPEPES